MPSGSPVPARTSGLLPPPPVVGSGTVLWRAPLESYSSRNAAVPEVVSAPDPSPTRRTTTFPGVKAAAGAAATTAMQVTDTRSHRGRWRLPDLTSVPLLSHRAIPFAALGRWLEANTDRGKRSNKRPPLVRILTVVARRGH